MSLMVGDAVPMRVLKSPHTKDFYCGGMCSKMRLISSLAVSSVIFRLVSELVGGIYTLDMLNFVLSGSCSWAV